MRRLALAAASATLIVFGFGSAYVFAQTGSTTKRGVSLCHSGGGKHFNAESPDATAVLEGHAGHAHDIIPPFELITGVATTNYPGKNLNASFGAGYTGAEVLANHCKVPTAGLTATTETVRTVVTEAIPTVLSIPVTVVTLGASRSTTVVTASMSVPETTATAAGATTVVTIAPGETTTVTVPPNTVTLPASRVTVRETITQPAHTVTVRGVTTALPATTVTVDGGVVTQAPETVTVPGTTQTVTASGTTTVVTVLAPTSQVVRGGAMSERLPVVFTDVRRLVRIRGHLLHVVLRRTRLTTKVIVIVLRPAAAGRG